jgi:putative ABC transport system substrate-binding protein
LVERDKEGLAELGYVEGRNIEFVWYFGDGKFERLPDPAIELIKLRVDVIMPATPRAIYAAKSASNSIPTVYPLGSDHQDGGLVSNLQRPGANARVV